MLQRNDEGNVVYLHKNRPVLVPHKRAAQAALIHLELYLLDIAPNMGKDEHEALQVIRDFLESR